MAQVNALLNERLKKGEHSSKMAALAKQSSSGQLTSFSGIFNLTELSVQEKEFLEELLIEFAPSANKNVASDLHSLISITSEVKAINNQAALLHGERIKKAQEILTSYREGAFSAWLIGTYGNRQTPYNLLQYYEFYEASPKLLRPLIELMPRQAVYTLASREGTFERKIGIVEKYNTLTKQELLRLIREEFPLDQKDKRLKKSADGLVSNLEKIAYTIKKGNQTLTKSQKNRIVELLRIIESHL